MNTRFLSLLSALTTICLFAQTQAAVQVSPPPESETEKPAAPQPTPAGAVEKPVAFQVGDKFLSSTTGGGIAASGDKIGSREGFTLIDLNGGEWADGDEVKVEYIPGKGKGLVNKGDVTKASFWTETADGVRRSHQGDTFKLKKMGAKYAFQTSKGKFVGPPQGYNLTVVDKPDVALLVDIIDLSGGIPKAPKHPKAEESSDSAAPTPAAAEKSADKPSGE